MLVALICTRLVVFAGSSSQAVGLDILKSSFMPVSFTDLPIGIYRHIFRCCSLIKRLRTLNTDTLRTEFGETCVAAGKTRNRRKRQLTCVEPLKVLNHLSEFHDR